MNDKILKENQFAQDIIFSILNRFKESSDFVLHKKNEQSRLDRTIFK